MRHTHARCKLLRIVKPRSGGVTPNFPIAKARIFQDVTPFNNRQPAPGRLPTYLSPYRTS